MSDWLDGLSPEERAQWESFVYHARRDAVPKIEGSNIFVSICPDKPDVKFAMELGFAVMYDKPIIALVLGGRPVPRLLRKVAKAVVHLDEEPGTEAGALEMERKLLPVLRWYGLAGS